MYIVNEIKIINNIVEHEEFISSFNNRKEAIKFIESEAKKLILINYDKEEMIENLDVKINKNFVYINYKDTTYHWSLLELKINKSKEEE